MAYDIGAKVGLEGEAEFKRGLKDINDNLKTLGTEMKAVTSAYDKNDKSAEALTAQNQVLNKQIDEQKAKLELLKGKLSETADKYGENDEKTKKMQQAVNLATADLNKMERQLGENESALKSAGDTAENSGGKFGGFGAALKGTVGAIGAIAVAAGAAAAAVGGMVMKVTDSLSEIADSSARAGVTAEEFQKYAYAAKLSGMETETLEKAMVKAQKSFADASTGGKTAGNAFKQLGIDVSTMTSDGAFDAAITALADMDDVTQRNAIANDIFGKSYAELAPLLNEGSAGIAALKEEAVAMGGVMSNESVASAEAFGDTLDTLKTAMGGVFNSVGVELIPIFQSLADWVLEHMPQIKETIGTAFDVVGKVVTTLYNIFKDNVLPILRDLWAWVEPQLPMIKAAFEKAFGFISDIVSKVWGIFKDNLLPILKTLWGWIEPTFPLIKGAVEVAFGAVVTIVQTVVDIFDDVTRAIKTAINWLTTWNKTDGTSRKNSRSSWDGGIDGSHAMGLDYVPFDGYIAELHKGEMVIPSLAAKELRKIGVAASNQVAGIAPISTAPRQEKAIEGAISGLAAIIGSQNGGGNYNINLIVDGRTLAGVVFDPLRAEMRQKGVSFA